MNKYFKWILVIAWMIIIFMFSNQPANISDEKSRFVVHLFNAVGINLNSVFGSLANFVVRKISHFSEYFIFYLLLFNAFHEKFEIKKVLFLSLIIVFLYACSDEIHQLFIPGRTGRIRDVIIDTCGGLTSLLCCFYYYKIKLLPILIKK